MAHTIWSQDVFSKGEISPLMYARVSVAPYYNGLKTATNVITFPQGAAGKRFGTIYNATIGGVSNANQIFFQTFQYLNECVYLIVVIPNAIAIYLEGILVFTVTSTNLGLSEIPLLDYTILDNLFRLTCGVVAPQDLSRSIDSGIVITSFNTSTNVITLTSATPYYTPGLILPVRFTAGTTLFGSTPQVLANKTYFLYFLSSTTAQIYSLATDAKAQINPISLTSSGTGTQTAFTLNNWSLNNCVFVNLPVFDFSGGANYQNNTVTFTPSALSGNSITITCSIANIFTADNVGGTFSSNDGGLLRIVSVNSPTNTIATGFTIVPFGQTSAYLGINTVVTQPAWSDSVGWPRCCSSFQNRAFFANTDLLPNGLWASVTNDFNNFNDTEVDADFAISWYPTSGDINYIRFIVPYRSLTIHSNSGVLSTPLSVETALTPLNFSLTLQDSTPAEFVQPRGIDNQIVILSGNDAHSLLWDGFNNAYQSNIISIANEQVIRDPVYEAAFTDLTRAGSRYMLIINADGSLAIYQTLISEEVQGFTPAILEQSYGNAYFRNVATNFDGRGWFITERQLGLEDNPIAITANTSTTLTATASNFLSQPVTAIQFQTTGTLPTANPPLMLNTWYWAVAIDDNIFSVYASQADAIAGINIIQFSDFGTSATVTGWPLETYFMIEELSFAIKVDCATLYNGSPVSSFAGLPMYDAQDIKIQGDGYGFDYVGIDETVQTIAHGITIPVSTAQFGFPINVTIEPLPLSIYSGSTKTSNLQTPKHIRSVSFMFSDTIGGEVNGQPIAMQTFAEVPIGTPPLPVNGRFEIGLMQGWDDYQDIGITITHSDPFDIKLIGLFYKVDV